MLVFSFHLFRLPSAFILETKKKKKMKRNMS